MAWNCKRFTPACLELMFAPLVLTSILIISGHPESNAAFNDRARHPIEQQCNQVYLSLCEVEPAQREKLANVLRFLVPSFSHKPHLGDQIPQAVRGTNLMRLDLGGLGWEKSWPQVIAKHYAPVYRKDLIGVKNSPIPLVVSGAWFAASIPDSNITGDAQYQLLYSTPPKTNREFQKFWQVNEKPELFFGRIEGDSGVAVQKTRLMQNHPTGNRGYSWVTFDSKIVAKDTDPLENLREHSQGKEIKHDASESIAAIPKYYAGKSGTLQAYFLSNGKGERQEKAPADIVVDHTAVRGVEIRNTISCIACHVEGLRLPSEDEYKSYILSGAKVSFLKKQDQQNVDRFYDSPIAKELQRNNQDYADGVALCNGLTPQENAANFKDIVQLYDRPVNLEQAARELYTNKPELQYALADYSRTYTLNGRLALLASDKQISREQWAQNYCDAQKILYVWQQTFNKVLQ